MGIRSWLSRKIKNAIYGDSIDLDDPRLWSGGGGYAHSATGETINAITAMRAPTYYACVDLISRIIAQLPLITYRVEPDGDVFPAVGSPLYNILANKPNNWQTPFDYWLYNITCLCTHGWFISYKQTSSSGALRGLIPLNPDSVTIEQDKLGNLYFSGGSWGLANNFNFKREPKSNFFFCHYRTLKDCVTPISPLSFYGETIGIELSSLRHGATLLKNDSTPPLLISFPETRTTAELKHFAQQWRDNATGENYGRPKFIDGGGKIERLSMSNEDAQYLQTREFTALSICGAFGVPPRLVGIERNAKGWATVEQQSMEFLQYGLSPWLERIHRAINRDLVSDKDANKIFAMFNVEKMLMADRKTQAEFFGFAIDKKVLSPNEVRLKLNLNKRVGGDDYSGNLAAMENAKDNKAKEGIPDA